MKQPRSGRSLFVSVTIGFMTLTLIGCASADKSMRTSRDYKKMLKKHSAAVPGQRPSPFSDELANREVIPELSSDTHEWSGDVHLQRGELELAYVEYNKSLKLDPDNARVLYKRGLVFLAGGLTQEAKAEFEKVLEWRPEHALARMGLGQVYFQQEKYGKAEEQLRKAIELDGKLWKSRNFLGIIHDYRGEYEWAVLQYLAAVALKPDSGLLYNNLGISHYLSGNYEKSVRAFRKALDLGPIHNKVYNNLGLALSKAGRMDEAFEAFRKGGGDAQAHNNLGCVYTWTGDSERAVRSFEKAIEVKPAFYTEADENLRNCLAGERTSFDLDRQSSFDDTIPKVN